MAGNFAIGAGMMIVPGILTDLSRDFEVSSKAVGLLISAFALTVCVGGPFLAAWTIKVERRRLLTATLLWYAVANLAAAVTPTYSALLLVRVASAIGAAIFTAQAAATVGLMVPAAIRGRAVGSVFLGWSMAAVLATPASAYLADHFGWRWPFAGVAVLSGLSAICVWRQVPKGLYAPAINLSQWRDLALDWPLMLAVSVTGFQSAGSFMVLSYLALVAKDSLNASAALVGVLFFCFGTTGVLGNMAAVRFMDRLGPVRLGVVAIGCAGVAQLLWPLAAGSLPLTVGLTLIWGVGGFSIYSAQQARLVGLAPHLASASVALNSSATYLGQAFGALAGGLIIVNQGSASLSYYSLICMILALAASVVAASAAARRLGVVRMSDVA